MSSLWRTVVTLALGIALGVVGYRLLDSGAVTARLGCRDLTDATFYQAMHESLGMWATGARVQMDDTQLKRQVEQVGYRVYIPLCPSSWARVVTEGERRGLHADEMEPWELELNVRLKP